MNGQTSQKNQKNQKNPIRFGICIDTTSAGHSHIHMFIQVDFVIVLAGVGAIFGAIN